MYGSMTRPRPGLLRVPTASPQECAGAFLCPLQYQAPGSGSQVLVRAKPGAKLRSIV